MIENFVVTFVVTLVALTFVVTLGGLFQGTDLLARGVSWKPILIIFLTGIPIALAFSIPVSVATASLLVFERLSSDTEITAMKACGVSTWQIVSRPILFSVLLACICLYIHTNLAARCHYFQRKTLHAHKEELAKLIWEPGRFVAVNGRNARYWVYVGDSRHDEKTGSEKITDIIIYVKKADDVEREIRASSGTVSTSHDGMILKFDLHDRVRIDPAIRNDPGYMKEGFQVAIDLTGSFPTYSERMADLTATDLIDGIVRMQKGEERHMAFSVELNQRIVLSFSCLAFALLGIPLGIRTRGSASSLRIVIVILMVFSFYVFVILVDSLATRRPDLRPDLIMWTPVVLSVSIGTYLLRRMR